MRLLKCSKVQKLLFLLTDKENSDKIFHTSFEWFLKSLVQLSNCLQALCFGNAQIMKMIIPEQNSVYFQNSYTIIFALILFLKFFDCVTFSLSA